MLQANDQSLEAAAYGALGIAHRLIGQYDKALGYHTQELNLRQELNDLRGECKAHGNLGNVHVSLGNYIQGYKVTLSIHPHICIERSEIVGTASHSVRNRSNTWRQADPIKSLIPSLKY